MFLRVQLTICKHWFRQWLGIHLVIIHFLNQWWPSLLAQICIGAQWVKNSAQFSQHSQLLIFCVNFSSTYEFEFEFEFTQLTHWGRVTHICVGKLTIIGSDNGLSPERRQAIIWTNAGTLLIGPLGTNLSEILIEIYTFSLKCIWKCRLGNGSHFVSASMC